MKSKSSAVYLHLISMLVWSHSLASRAPLEVGMSPSPYLEFERPSLQLDDILRKGGPARLYSSPDEGVLGYVETEVRQSYQPIEYTDPYQIGYACSVNEDCGDSTFCCSKGRCVPGNICYKG